MEKELNANIRVKLLTELIVYDFRAGTYLRVGGGRVQDKYLRKILDRASVAAHMSPEERRAATEQKKNAYRETLRDIRPSREEKKSSPSSYCNPDHQYLGFCAGI